MKEMWFETEAWKKCFREIIILSSQYWWWVKYVTESFETHFLSYSVCERLFKGVSLIKIPIEGKGFCHRQILIEFVSNILFFQIQKRKINFLNLISIIYFNY